MEETPVRASPPPGDASTVVHVSVSGAGVRRGRDRARETGVSDLQWATGADVLITAAEGGTPDVDRIRETVDQVLRGALSSFGPARDE